MLSLIATCDICNCIDESIIYEDGVFPERSAILELCSRGWTTFLDQEYPASTTACPACAGKRAWNPILPHMKMYFKEN